LRFARKFTRSGKQPIGFAEGMCGNGMPPKVGFWAKRGQKRAVTKKTPLPVASGSRQGDLLTGRPEYGVEVTAINLVDRQRVELSRR
jgi:hypothetical protein